MYQLLSNGSLYLLLGLGASLAQAQICTREYAPVCGLAPGQTTPQTFSNSCVLKAANGKELSKGACSGDGLPLAGSDTDSHGCKGSAGYQWSEELTSWLSSAVTLEVAARRRTCTGLFEKQCLVVREIPEKVERIQAKPDRSGCRYSMKFQDSKKSLARPIRFESGKTDWKIRPWTQRIRIKHYSAGTAKATCFPFCTWAS